MGRLRALGSVPGLRAPGGPVAGIRTPGFRALSIRALSIRALGIRAADVALTVVVIGAVELFVATATGPGQSPLNAEAYILGAVIALPVLLRRRWPLQALIACSVLLLIYYTVDRRNITPAPLLVVPVYDAAVAGYLAWAITLPASFMVVGLIVVEASEHYGLAVLVAQFWTSIVLLALAVALGEVVRGRHKLAAETAERLRMADEEREAEAARQVAEERLRIARDLHDTVAHSMATITVQAGSALHVLTRGANGRADSTARRGSDSATRDGTRPESARPEGATRDSATSDGATSDGAGSESAGPHGAGPHGAGPHGAGPHGAAPDAAGPDNLDNPGADNLGADSRGADSRGADTGGPGSGGDDPSGAANREPTDELRTALAAIRDTSKAALAEMRTTLGRLRASAGPGEADGDGPPGDRTGGLDRLPALCGAVTAAGAPVQLEVTGEKIPLPPAVDQAAYRILQESLTNVLRHAGPDASAAVRICYQPGALTVTVADDGTGGSGGGAPGAADFATATPADVGHAAGHGITGMTERAAALGGALTAGPRPRGGFQVRATLPLPLPSGAPAPGGETGTPT